MAQSTVLNDPGFEMHDLLESREFAQREPNRRVTNRQELALHEIVQRISDAPESMLQKLVEVAVEYCGADSAGVSLEESDGKGGLQFRWIVVAGTFEKYLHGTTPRNFSPCGVCVDQWRPQHYKVTKPYYDFLGVIAEPIRDGMLIPWQSDAGRGTIWAVSHAAESVFDSSDYELLRRLADLVAAAIRLQSNASR